MKIKRNALSWLLAGLLAIAGTSVVTAQQVRNSSGSYQGRIESNGRVYNSSGSYVGEARGVDTRTAAVLFFFHFI